jgi:diguanylate cyclase (GGDEF)-like protein/PAS domain S-box-containing protein
MSVLTHDLAISAAEPDAIALAQAHRTLQRVLGAIEEYVYVGEFLPDDCYRVVFAGPCRDRFLGMSIEQARSAVWADYVHPADMDVFDEAHEGAHRTGRLDAEYRIVGADGVVRWVRDRGRLRDEDGRRLLDGSVLDVTAIKTARVALENAEAEAQRIAQLDPLTGVWNRRSLQPRLAAVGDRALGVLSIDIDNFKNVNDLFGHAAGDAVLVAVAERLRESRRDADAIFRMGGEEFLMILPDLRDDTALLDVAEAVRRRIEIEPVLFSGEPIELTASIGAARTDCAVDAAEWLLVAADRALYTAKRSGRNRVRLASPNDAPYDEIDTDCATLRLAEAMASVGATVDATSGTHSAEVSRLAARVARRLDNSPVRILRCRLAGLLHDLGKLQLPASIRSKPGPLSNHEWSIMRRHSALGEALIAAVPDLRFVAPIVRQHHERYDGAGYPDGLAETEILIEARILAAANTWVAMTTPRPHQPALSTHAALLELDRVAGTQLDPDVVTTLKSVLAHPRDADTHQNVYTAAATRHG